MGEGAQEALDTAAGGVASRVLAAARAWEIVTTRGSWGEGAHRAGQREHERAEIGRGADLVGHHDHGADLPQLLEAAAHVGAPVQQQTRDLVSARGLAQHHDRAEHGLRPILAARERRGAGQAQLLGEGTAGSGTDEAGVGIGHGNLRFRTAGAVRRIGSHRAQSVTDSSSTTVP